MGSNSSNRKKKNEKEKDKNQFENKEIMNIKINKEIQIKETSEINIIYNTNKKERAENNIKILGLIL